jgi:hypothetical protein
MKNFFIFLSFLTILSSCRGMSQSGRNAQALEASTENTQEGRIKIIESKIVSSFHTTTISIITIDGEDYTVNSRGVIVRLINRH